jgi:L-ascorbate metabolism protein UlaG (beta-lactamase superfamily)
MLEVGQVIGYHYGTFGLLTGTPAQLGEELEKLGLETEVVTLEVGEAV